LAAFIAPEREQLLKFNHLSGFDEIWQRQAEWFEAPNERRGGWSGVCRLGLELPGGGQIGVFLKRQENHRRLTLCHPIAGEPTFAREFRMLRYLDAQKVPAPQVVFFGKEVVDGKLCGILMTEELAGFRPLDVVTEEMLKGNTAITAQRQLLRSVALTVRKLHDAKIHHRSLYPKHLFVRQRSGVAPEVVVIDLEKSRTKLISMLRTYYDLATLNRHAKLWSRNSRLYFFKQYIGIKKLTPWTKFLCRQIIRRTGRG
jgi:tRNA A-37 threonylcarbamoyl transferase component Bud32